MDDEPRAEDERRESEPEDAEDPRRARVDQRDETHAPEREPHREDEGGGLHPPTVRTSIDQDHVDEV